MKNPKGLAPFFSVLIRTVICGWKSRYLKSFTLKTKTVVQWLPQASSVVLNRLDDGYISAAYHVKIALNEESVYCLPYHSARLTKFTYSEYRASSLSW